MGGIVRFKDFCFDANDPSRVGAFWSAALGRTLHHQDNGDTFLTGTTPEDTIWINGVPEGKTVKNRVHIDVTSATADVTATVASLVDLGATVLRPQDDEISWTVMADPEGNEFCVFAPKKGT